MKQTSWVDVNSPGFVTRPRMVATGSATAARTEILDRAVRQRHFNSAESRPRRFRLSEVVTVERNRIGLGPLTIAIYCHRRRTIP